MGVSVFEITGRWLIRSLNQLGEFFYLFFQTVKQLFRFPYRWKDTLKQLNFVMIESAPIVVFCVCAAAAVTIVESSFHMKIVIKNDELVPGFAALLILRELGVVISALLITSRVGAGLAAEVGTMKITEQIDALKMLSMNPVRFIVLPRFIACVIGGVILSFVANLICLYVAMLISEYKLGYSTGSFIVAMRSFVEIKDLWFAAIKGGVFGSVIPIVSCYYGFKCKSGAEGVGLATTNAVVTSSVMIIGLDFMMSWLFSYYY
ncbi:MAG: organic solvent ABC transporter permease [Bdellovibrionaceae bacterium]|nr:organic solvent ABC transporter permease [Pseudobdellovibrionaceae bacterium]|tara:strand:+ start:696 stop:1481 length:786 start_codon:yes stop_codon:yes gene_type:complete